MQRSTSSILVIAILLTVGVAHAKPSTVISPDRATQMQQKIARILSVDSSFMCTVRESSPETENKVEVSRQPVARLVERSLLAANPAGTWGFERDAKTNNIRVSNYIGEDFGTSGSNGQTGYDNALQEEFTLSPDGKSVLKVSTRYNGVDYDIPPKGQTGGYKNVTARNIECGQ